MHEGRRLKSLARLLVCHLVSGELAQLFVDQRQKLFGRRPVARLDGR